MTQRELERRFPNAGSSFIKLNAEAGDSGKVAVMERDSGDEPLEANQGQETVAGRVHIRFESVRKRLLDPDNLSVKWMLDCLRYCGAISGDEPEKITLEVGQRKCAKGEAECTVVEIFAA